MSKIRLTDRALRAAAVEYRDAMLAAMPEPEVAEFEPSPRYKANMARLLRKMERKERLHRYVRRAAAAVLVFVLGSGAFIGLNGEVRADFLAWLRTTYENCVIYRYTASESNAPLPQCELTRLPEGYELVSNDRSEDSLVMVYENGDGNCFIFACDRMAESGLMQTGITKEFTSENLTVNDSKAELIRFQDGELSLVWFDNKSNFIYSLNGNSLDEFVILHIAENVKITQ